MAGIVRTEGSPAAVGLDMLVVALRPGQLELVADYRPFDTERHLPVLALVLYARLLLV
jgi:hypothetical protein